MLETLFEVDKNIFIFINNTLKNDFFDVFFVYITEKSNWFIPLFLVILLLISAGGRKGREFVLISMILILITDQLTSNLLKDVFMRQRPFLLIPNARQLVLSGNFSFPSSHAANSAGIAFLASKYYPDFKFSYWIAVFLLSFSRIYVGVHYPIDVLAGVFIGILCGLIILKLKEI